MEFAKITFYQHPRTGKWRGHLETKGFGAWAVGWDKDEVLAKLNAEWAGMRRWDGVRLLVFG